MLDFNVKVQRAITTVNFSAIPVRADILTSDFFGCSPIVLLALSLLFYGLSDERILMLMKAMCLFELIILHVRHVPWVHRLLSLDVVNSKLIFIYVVCPDRSLWLLINDFIVQFSDLFLRFFCHNSSDLIADFKLDLLRLLCRHCFSNSYGIADSVSLLLFRFNVWCL